MKHCRPGWKRWVGFAFMLFLLISMILFAVYQLIWGTAVLPSERIYMLLGIPLFVTVLVYLTLHVLCCGAQGIDYDDEKIVFHFSKKREKTYRWEELAREKILFTQTPIGYVFLFPNKKEYVINKTMVGFSDLMALLTKKDMLQKDSDNIFSKPDELFVTKIFKSFFK